MGQSVRQSELFSAQDWRVLYQAFTNVNFNASDPVSINKALREYIQTNYAEDFKDWIESSEFVALIDLLAWLAGTLAYKTDITARENFLESAEARESILRLARFLSYNPSRNKPARGLLKLVSALTDDEVYDAFGNNLANLPITWNDGNDSDWFERMIIVMNTAFVATNPFGVPLKTGTTDGIRTHLYRLDTNFGAVTTTYMAQVAGSSMRFEMINADYDTSLGFLERIPNQYAAFHLAYRSDGNGNSSFGTGFFIPFKQGELRNQVFTIADPTENLVLDINENGVNDSDVWVQTIDPNTSEVLADWTQVPVVPTDNPTYTSLAEEVRDIYSVITRTNDQISIRFGDGRFGTAPRGTLRVWYRVSNGQTYQIRPKDMGSVKIAIPYRNKRGIVRTLTLEFALQEAVGNSVPTETDEQIRQRAPQVYATQNRMVSGEDYNTFPLKTNLATKIKAVNRVYAGQSRSIDLADPTGTYRDTLIYGDDGIFYKEMKVDFAEFALTENYAPEEVFDIYIQPMVAASDVHHYVVDYHLRAALDGYVPVSTALAWTQVSDSRFASTGFFSRADFYVQVGSMLLMAEPNAAKPRQRWVSVAAIRDDDITSQPRVGFSGPVTLSEAVPTGWTVVRAVPRYMSTIPASVVATILTRLREGTSFSLWYDYNAAPALAWTVRAPVGINDLPRTVGTAVKIMTADYLDGALWRFAAQGLRYVFESVRQVRFFYDGQKTSAMADASAAEDMVTILKTNEDLNTDGRGFPKAYELSLDRMITYTDGYADPRRILVRFRDSDEDGAADDPDLLYRVMSREVRDTLLFWGRDQDGVYKPVYGVYVYTTEFRRKNAPVDVGTVAFQIFGDKPESFWLMTDTGWQPLGRLYKFGQGRGPNVAARWFDENGLESAKPTPYPLSFQWRHHVPGTRRVDPSPSNIIDIFVLTSEYDTAMRQWLAKNASLTEMPQPPSDVTVRNAFQYLEEFKMTSDEIIWRTGRYRLLFGRGADENLRAQFKIVKLPNATLSDGEIKGRVVRAINTYFSAEYWDFGETFYFTELAAFVHQQLASSIASFVIVPLADSGVFGDGFEVRCRSDELFLSTASVNDIVIIDSNTPVNLRIS